MVAPWRSLQALTPDATQLADPTWRPHPFTLPGVGGVSSKWLQAADWARQGRINNLSLMALDVLMAPHDGKDRYFAPICLAYPTQMSREHGTEIPQA